MTIQNPLFQPPSEWVCPEYIDYKGQSPVAIDLETYDPGIKEHGPGWATAVSYTHLTLPTTPYV